MSQALISDALIFSRRRPRRPLISFFMRWYSILVAVFVSLIIVLSTWPCDPVLTAVILMAYWGYQGVKLFMRRHERMRSYYKSDWLHLGRSIVLLLGISAWLAYVYLRTDYLTQSGQDNTLWLLLLLAVLIMSQRGVTELLLAVVAVAALCLAMVTFLAVGGLAGSRFSLTLMLDIGVKGLWLILLAFIMHVLVRYLGDFNANVRLIHSVQEQILRVEKRIIESPTESEEKDLLEVATRLIASDFGYPHVNVFFLQSDGSLKCMAGACSAGKLLAQEGYCLKSGVGIIGHAVSSEESYPSNNVDKDDHFFEHPAFPLTQAELAVPIRAGDEVIGVLDVQAHRRGFFFDQDLEVMEIMTGYLGKSIDNIRMHGWRQKIAEIVESITSRVLSEYELEGTLNEIAKAAHKEFGADVVVLYERDPVNGTVTGPVYAGNALHPEIFARTKLDPDSSVFQLLSRTEDFYYHEDILLVPKDLPFTPSGFHLRTNKPDFATREGIRSRAIFRLNTGMGCVGLMFLNFRSPQRFTEQEKRMFSTFAHLAALSIQKAQYHQQQMLLERREISRSLHDQLKSHTFGLTQLIEALLADKQLTDGSYALIRSARDAVQALRRDIRYLDGMLKDASLDSLPREVEKLIERVRNTFGTRLSVTWSGPGERVPSMTGRELRLILNEAVLNGIRHGNATRVEVSFKVSDCQLIMTLEDNGYGFDIGQIGDSGGIANMENRIARMGGNLKIESAPGEGTRVVVEVPVQLTSRREQ